MITRKTYVEVAKIIKEEVELPNPDRELLDHLAGKLADMFKADNPRFDRYRFLKACGLLP